MKMRRALYTVPLLFILLSCSPKPGLQEETERKDIIDAERNDLIKTENPEIVETILNLDDTLNELDQALNGEAGDFLDSFENTNQMLRDIKVKLNTLEKDLYDQAEALELMRLQTIEPIISDVMKENEALKTADNS